MSAETNAKQIWIHKMYPPKEKNVISFKGAEL